MFNAAVLPPCLTTVSLYVCYEITRVFLHANVPISELELPISLNLNDYDVLWRFLKNLPVLKDKPFPERCGQEVWSCALSDFRRGCRGIVMSSSLRFRNSSSGSFFQFQFAPLKLEFSHRLERRFGNDRFLEIDVPDLAGRQTPKLLQDLGDEGRAILCEWLVDGMHKMLGRVWKPFHVKPKDGRERKVEVTQLSSDELDTGTAHKVYFLAVDGNGFLEKRTLPDRSEPAHEHTKMSVYAMLNWIRLFRKNKGQPYLKLFSRTSLGSYCHVHY